MIESPKGRRQSHLLPSAFGLTGEKAFEVYLRSEKQIVEATESWKINCSTSCATPDKGGLETSMDKVMLEQHPQGRWIQFLVSNVSSDTVFLCHFMCSGKQGSDSLNIRVYRECLCLGPYSPGQCPCLLLLLLLLLHTNCSVTPPGSSHYEAHLPQLPSHNQARPVCGLSICFQP